MKNYFMGAVFLLLQIILINNRPTEIAEFPRLEIKSQSVQYKNGANAPTRPVTCRVQN